MNIRHKLTQNP